MQYSYRAKNTNKDKIYTTRLKLINQLNININNNSRMYNYYMDAELRIILI